MWQKSRSEIFPSDLLESSSYDFYEIAQHKTLYGVERHHKSSFKSKEFLEIEKRPKMAAFFAYIPVIQF